MRRTSSLGGRLLVGSALFTFMAVFVALILMFLVLQRFVTGQVDQRLDNKIVSLASQLRAGPGATISLDGVADGPPFDKPRHRSFWWIRGPANSLHTGWLRDGDFSPPDQAALDAMPAPRQPPEPRPDDDSAEPVKARTIATAGPRGAAMHVRVAERSIAGVPVAIFVAAPVAAIAGPMREAMVTIGFCMAGLAVALLLGILATIRLGLRPLARLRLQIASVRSGDRPQLPVAQPVEIRPLVLEINSLLSQNAENLSRARRHVANLAHGLKTPLATLALTVDRIDGADRPALRALVAVIEQRIRHHLGRARAAALDGPVRTRTRLAASIADLVAVLDRLHLDKGIRAMVDCPDQLAVSCEPQDIDEILGNVLENAYKFGRSRVACSARSQGRFVEIDIEDDGPGLSPDEIARVMKPGQRLDEGVPGYGFGLSIARELVELYAGEMTAVARGGGLLMRLRLPSALADLAPP